jgi:membrane protein DedA with SNARE-associated domain
VITVLEALNAVIDSAMSSSWALPVIFLASALDAVLVVVPSETTVIAGASLAAAGQQNLLWVIVLAAAGALTGDHVCYLLGRTGASRLLARTRRRPTPRDAANRAAEILRDRGALLLVAIRFVPGGRTAATLAAGTVSYPLPRFSPLVLIGGACWAIYASLIGYLAGTAFSGNHLLAVTIGLGPGITIGLLSETLRLLRNRAHQRPKLDTGP